MVGRFIGSALLHGVKTVHMLICAAIAGVLLAFSYIWSGPSVATTSSGIAALPSDFFKVLVNGRPLVALSFVVLVLLTLASGRGQTPPVRLLCSSSPNSICRPLTSSRCRFVPIHSSFIFRRYLFLFMLLRGKQKTLLTLGKQGFKSLYRYFTCLPPVYPYYLRAVSRSRPRIVQG